MSQPGGPPPWSALIESVRNGNRLSMREAARRAGISEGWWRRVVKGDPAPAATIARMALAAQVTPGQMENMGGNPEAAAIMRSQIGRASEPLDDQRPLATPEMNEAIQRHLPLIEAYVSRAQMRYPGQRLTGEMVFPDSPVDSMSWNELAKGRTPALAAYLLASVWVEEEAEAAEKRRNWGGS